MSKRALFVVLLFGLLLADRAFFVVAQFSVDDYGIRGIPKGGQLVLYEVPETDDFGQPFPLAQAGAREGDRLLALYDAEGNGGRIHSLADFGDLRRNITGGQPCIAVVLRTSPDGASQLLTLDVPSPPQRQVSLWGNVLAIGLQLWLPLLAASAAFFIGILRPRDDLAFLASLMFFSFATIFLEPPLLRPPGLREVILVFRDVASHLAAYLLMLFFLRFPSPSPLDQRFPWLKRVALLPALVFLVFGTARDVSAYWSFEAYDRIAGLLDAIGVGFLQSNVVFPISAAMITIGIFSLGIHGRMATSERDRRRLRLLEIGTAVGLGPVFILALVAYLKLSLPDWLVAVLMVLVSAFPLTFIYVVVRHRVFGIRLIIRRGLQYALLSRGVLIAEGFALFVALTVGVTPFISDVTNLPEELLPVGTAFVALALGVGLRSVNRRLLPVIDRHFFRDEYDARRLLMDLSRAARQLVARPAELLEMVSEQMLHSLHPDQIAIFLGRESWSYMATGGGPERAGNRPDPGIFRLYLHRYEPFLRHGERRLGDPGLAADIEDIPSPFDAVDRGSDALDRIPDFLDLDPEAMIRRSGDGEALPECWEILRSAFNTRLVVPLVAGDTLLGFVALGEKLSEEPYSKEDRDMLMAVTEQVAVALDYSRLVGRIADQERLERELEIAKSVQGHLFPQELPPIPTLVYDGWCLPAQGVGGDYFDFIKLDEHRLVLALGDISGKGISAALLMASLQGSLRGHVSLKGHDLVGLVGELNQLLCQSSDPGKFASFFCGLYDSRTRELTYVNAGHLPPMLLRGSANPGAGATGTNAIERLQPGGLVIGLLEDVDYEARSVRISPRDTLVLFTDGVTEAERPDGEMFDEWRLVDLVRENADLGPSELRKLIESEIRAFTGDAEQSDDITLICARGT